MYISYLVAIFSKIIFCSHALKILVQLKCFDYSTHKPVSIWELLGCRTRWFRFATYSIENENLF